MSETRHDEPEVDRTDQPGLADQAASWVPPWARTADADADGADHADGHPAPPPTDGDLRRSVDAVRQELAGHATTPHLLDLAVARWGGPQSRARQVPDPEHVDPDEGQAGDAAVEWVDDEDRAEPVEGLPDEPGPANEPVEDLVDAPPAGDEPVDEAADARVIGDEPVVVTDAQVPDDGPNDVVAAADAGVVADVGAEPAEDPDEVRAAGSTREAEPAQEPESDDDAAEEPTPVDVPAPPADDEPVPQEPGRDQQPETDRLGTPGPALGVAPPGLEPAQLAAALEAILMVVDEPVGEITLAQVLGVTAEEVAGALIDLSASYTRQGRGFDLRRAAGGWRFYTRAEYADYVQRFVLDGQQLRLTQASLETLAVVAYKQPVTRGRISAIRGVNCDGVIRTLVTRGLIEECGSDPESGAHLYRTTGLFLEKLGLNTLDQLPPLAPFLPDDIESVAAEVIDGPA